MQIVNDLSTDCQFAYIIVIKSPFLSPSPVVKDHCASRRKSCSLFLQCRLLSFAKKIVPRRILIFVSSTNYCRLTTTYPDSSAEAMKSKTGKVAANTLKCTPKVGHEGMRVVKNNRPRIKPLPYVRIPNQQKPFALRPSRHPCKRKVGDKMVVVVESADVAVAAGE